MRIISLPSGNVSASDLIAADNSADGTRKIIFPANGNIGSTVPTNTNINDVTKPGVYFLSGNNAYTNVPIGNGVLEVFTSSTGSEYLIQRISGLSQSWYRYKVNTTWGSWFPIGGDTSGTTSGIYWKKCLDGTLIQSGKVTGISFSNVVMVEGEIDLPVSFDGTGYTVIGNAASTSNNSYLMRVGMNANSASKIAWTMGSGDGAAISVSNRQLNWIAFGRWQ